MTMLIGKAYIELPEDHFLDEICRTHPTYDFVHWNMISSVIHENAIEDIALVDIGANVGDSVAHFRRCNSGKVIAVEPDPEFGAYCVKNCAQFDDVEVIHSLVCPKELQGAVSFEKRIQTARTFLSTEESNYSGTYVTVSELFSLVGDSVLLKTDTDGFDAEILLEAAKLVEKGFDGLKIVSFEGPSEEQMRERDYKSFLKPIEMLQANGFQILIMTNLGYPVSFAGCDFSHVEWHLNRLSLEFSQQRASCHYFDFLAVAGDLSCNTFRFEDQRVFAEVYS